MGRRTKSWGPRAARVATAGRLGPRTVAALGLGVAILLAGCGSDDGGGDAGKPQTSASVGDAATVTASSTTAPTSTTVAGPAGTPEPHAAAQTLYDAWKAGDKARAATVAVPEAVAGVWAAAPGDYALYNECNTGEFGSSACLYRGDAGTIQFAMEQHGTSWVVVEAVFSTS